MEIMAVLPMEDSKANAMNAINGATLLETAIVEEETEEEVLEEELLEEETEGEIIREKLKVNLLTSLLEQSRK